MARMRYVSGEHRRMVALYGKWYEIRVKGFGTICIRELMPALALQEAALRWEVEVDQLKDAVVTELAS